MINNQSINENGEMDGESFTYNKEGSSLIISIKLVKKNTLNGLPSAGLKHFDRPHSI